VGCYLSCEIAPFRESAVRKQGAYGVVDHLENIRIRSIFKDMRVQDALCKPRRPLAVNVGSQDLRVTALEAIWDPELRKRGDSLVAPGRERAV